MFTFPLEFLWVLAASQGAGGILFCVDTLMCNLAVKVDYFRWART